MSMPAVIANGLSTAARFGGGRALSPRRFLLWIDGVGTYLLCLDDAVTIGAGGAADVELLANVSRRHATVVRSGESYLLDAHCPTRINEKPVEERIHLQDGSRIELGGVGLRFRMPSVLSRSACLDIDGERRTALPVDGVILMDETCLLGPGREHHIVCPDADGTLLIVHRKERLYCRSRTSFTVNGITMAASAAIGHGDTVAGPSLRFRLEQLPPAIDR